MNTDRQTIGVLLDAISQSYPGRFEVMPKTKDSVGTVTIWYHLLKDLPANCVLGAGYKYLGEDREWPPTPGCIRHLALDLVDGDLAPKSPWMAWERVWRLSQGEDVQLTEEEQRALDAIGKLRALKTSTSLSHDRHAFVEHYRNIIREKRAVTGALPRVRELAEHNRPALPKRTNQPGPDDSIWADTRDDEPPTTGPLATPEQIRELLKGLEGYNDNGEGTRGDASDHSDPEAGDQESQDGVTAPALQSEEERDQGAAPGGIGGR